MWPLGTTTWYCKAHNSALRCTLRKRSLFHRTNTDGSVWAQAAHTAPWWQCFRRDRARLGKATCPLLCPTSGRRDCPHGVGGCSAGLTSPKVQGMPDTSLLQVPASCSKAAQRGSPLGSSPVSSCACGAGTRLLPAGARTGCSGSKHTSDFFAASGSLILGHRCL